jgi:hypothetical protein
VNVREQFRGELETLPANNIRLRRLLKLSEEQARAADPDQAATAGRAACTAVTRLSRSHQRQALAAAENEETPNSDGSVPVSRCEPDKARRHGWRRRRLRRTVTAGAATAATAGSAARLRTNRRRLHLLRWGRRLLW